MLYQGPEGSSTPGKPVLPWRQVNVLAIYSESNRQYRLFGPTAVVHSADWLNLNTFPPAEDALPRSKGLLSAWKNGSIIHSDGKSMFWPWYWIAPWIHITHFLSSGQWHTVLTGSTRISVHPWSQSGLVWFSINGQNIDLPLWHNRSSGCWGVFWSLVEYLWRAKEWPGGISQHSVPL